MKIIPVLLALALVTAACSGSAGNSIERVTPLPSLTLTPPLTLTPSLTLTAPSASSDAADTATASPTPMTDPATQTPALAVDTQPSNPTATSALAALMAQAPTATPMSNNLPAGSAADIAAATDTVIRLTPRAPITFDALPVGITFDEFYDGYDLRTGLILSDKLLSLDGIDVVMEGYMAPPLKPELDYFVLTRIRLAFCPFCSNASDWPDDIALIYLPEQTMSATEYPVRITGRMEVGVSVDPETGMVSMVRIYAHDVEILS
ncbi:MAG: hypothetical protein SF162_06910 [bacterium]|nr:hypothetical protein [bacterium]